MMTTTAETFHCLVPELQKALQQALLYLVTLTFYLGNSPTYHKSLPNVYSGISPIILFNLTPNAACFEQFLRIPKSYYTF